MNSERAEREALFWQLADQMSADGNVTRSTMMGFPCLRLDGTFFACVDRATGNLIIKLPADRVHELISASTGVPFAPNGRVFREWVAITHPDPTRWTDLLIEARTFADHSRRASCPPPPTAALSQNLTTPA